MRVERSLKGACDSGKGVIGEGVHGQAADGHGEGELGSHEGRRRGPRG